MSQKRYLENICMPCLWMSSVYKRWKWSGVLLLLIICCLEFTTSNSNLGFPPNTGECTALSGKLALELFWIRGYIYTTHIFNKIVQRCCFSTDQLLSELIFSLNPSCDKSCFAIKFLQSRVYEYISKHTSKPCFTIPIRAFPRSLLLFHAALKITSW